MATPLRSIRCTQAFVATGPKAPPARSLHITGAQNQPSSYLAFQARVAELGRRTETKPAASSKSSRPFNTHRALQRRGDSSPIDLCYFPTSEVPAHVDGVLPQIPLIPLTPTAARPPRLSDLQHGEPLPADSEPSRQIIATTSGTGLDDGRVAAMHEAEGGAGADAAGIVGSGGLKRKGELRMAWDGFIDDLLGAGELGSGSAKGKGN